ncbi:NADH-quinone oxidoreductase chain E [Gordonia sihwensis NBRC 108236]|uniref:NADH-quinone oxidoreductase chain E n=2 Tax=Gordonia TaxID=2053 RepID=L7LJX4_9ACTN|nr:NADH-quinone oxidoreductase subunit NuoE [Gordonia sp. YC-JH1]GAC61174.1 NADH-quinone oxidoreductase chain E [Gordonia sihwensis NBRC 108236]
MNEPVRLELSAGPPVYSTGVPHPPVEFAGPEHYSAEDTAALADDAATIIGRYPQSRSALLPLLHLVQSHDGYLTRAGIAFCAEQLDLTAAQVASVATFYSMYRRAPTGDYLVGICTNTLCAVMGGDAIASRITDELGVRPGETTADGRVTVEHVECNAACDHAPVVMVNWEFFDDQTPESVQQLLDDLRAGVPRSPTRGSDTLCTFRQTARLLAGVEEAPK